MIIYFHTLFLIIASIVLSRRVLCECRILQDDLIQLAHGYVHLKIENKHLQNVQRGELPISLLESC